MGFAPLSNEGTSLSSSLHRPRSGCFPTASLEVRRPGQSRTWAVAPDSLSSTSSPAFAFPRCCHRFGPEQQARIAFRPRRFARPRRFTPPITRVFTRLLITVQGDEGLADLLRSAANRRVRCVSSASSGGVSPAGDVIADGVCCCSLGLAVPRIEVRTPRRIPPTCSRSTSPWPLPPRTFRAPSIRDRPEESVSRFSVLAVSKGRCPSRLCSAGGSVPSKRRLKRLLAYPPWALFPFEVSFMSVLSFRPVFDDALHHRRPALAYRRNRVRPIHCLSTIARGSVRRAPCRVQVLCARDPSCLGNPTYSSSVCVILQMTPRRVVALPSHSSVFPSMKTSDSRGVTRARLRRRFADPPSSCGVLSDTIGSEHREVLAQDASILRGYHRQPVPCGSGWMTRARQVQQGGYPAEVSVDEPDGHPSFLSLVSQLALQSDGHLPAPEGAWLPFDRVRSAWNRVCPERKLLPDPVASMKSRSIVRRRAHVRVVSHPAASLRRGLGLPPWGF